MSDYTTKYRPQKISELDLTSVREGLEKVLKSGKIPHAFLFCGPRGTGKTSAARIIAKAVNCTGRTEKQKDEKTKKQKSSSVSQFLSTAEGGFEPCNQCDQCFSITAGTNLDVLEIDAASNRGIDDIRDLREKIKLAPSKASFKVYIIDEAHMLTLEAFNALLKTLEEPPKHAIFILCTTLPEKLPETIISRCLRFNFKRASISEIVAKLEKIAALEKLDVESVALKEIGKSVSGSFRDAQKILEQASFSGGKITTGEITEILGKTVGLKPEKLIEFLASKDVKGGISEIGRVVEIGGNLRVYTEELLELLRAGLLAQLGVSELDGTEALKITEALKVEDIKILIEIFSKAASELKDAVIPQLPLELAVVEWCGYGGGVGGSVAQGDLGGNVRKITSPSLPRSAGRAINQACPPEAGERSTISTKRSDPGSVSLEEIQARWREVLLATRTRNHSVEALLRATRPIALSGGVLTLEVFYKFHKDQLETEKCRRIVEEVASEFLGMPTSLKCILGEKKVTAETQTEAETQKESASLRPDERRGPAVSAVPGNGETTDEDIIKVAEEIFSGIVE